MNILQEIFTDYYEEIKYTFHPGKTEMENIDKMINCGDPFFGGVMYGCPVIATSQIDKYDGEMITFHYNRHEYRQYIEETVPAMEFIQRLIRHMPEKHFKIIR